MFVEQTNETFEQSGIEDAEVWRTLPLTKRPQTEDDRRAHALVRSLAGDMPLRLALTRPDDRPSLSSAAMRLRRFVGFHPELAGAALFDRDGILIAASDLRASGSRIESDLFSARIKRSRDGLSDDVALARFVSPFGGETLLFCDVDCPRGDHSCGVVVVRLR
ncbi:MAG: PDC sensor domain-containing protein [Pacificimonas sp.]